MIDAAILQIANRAAMLRSKQSREFWILTTITLLHIPLGVATYLLGPIAILHPILIFCLGVYLAIKKQVRLERVAMVIAYLIGIEVLWRMANVPIFWEFGKYGSSVIATIALVRRNHFAFPKFPLAYFCALVPACVLTLTQMELGDARGELSSGMSGPFFLVISCWFFSNIRITASQLRQLFFWIIIPLLSVAFATLFFTVSIQDIQFGGESNFATSGGFGPNQVSSMLGLGAFVCMLCLIVFKNSMKYQAYLMLAGIFFSAQSVLTFSRGGMYNAVGAIIVVCALQFRDPRSAAKRFAPVIGIAVVFFIFVFPFLNNFTGGSLQERFEDTETTHRADIIEADVEIFLENPFLGIGVGAAHDYRERILDYKAMSHTEFSRLISEHGALGLLAIFSLIAMLVINVKRQRSLLGRAVVAGCSAWAILFMLNADMRLAAPSFMWGLMFVSIVKSIQKEPFDGPRKLQKPRIKGLAPLNHHLETD